jgi:hypothetical protein
VNDRAPRTYADEKRTRVRGVANEFSPLTTAIGKMFAKILFCCQRSFATDTAADGSHGIIHASFIHSFLKFSFVSICHYVCQCQNLLHISNNHNNNMIDITITQFVSGKHDIVIVHTTKSLKEVRYLRLCLLPFINISGAGLFLQSKTDTWSGKVKRLIELVNAVQR